MKSKNIYIDYKSFSQRYEDLCIRLRQNQGIVPWEVKKFQRKYIINVLEYIDESWGLPMVKGNDSR